MRRAPICLLAGSALALAAPDLACADPQPLWEVGLGVGALAFNDYRGAATSHVWPAPVPYFIYRGDFLRSDRDGVRGRFFDHRYLEFEISVNATPPVFSRHSEIRQGMPNLEP